jgi:hypothetical protein
MSSRKGRKKKREKLRKKKKHKKKLLTECLLCPLFSEPVTMAQSYSVKPAGKTTLGRSQRYFLLQQSRPTVRPTRLPSQWIYRFRVRRSEREFVHNSI